MFKFNDDKSYRKFIHSRDEALDKIYRNLRLRNTDDINAALTSILSTIKFRYERAVRNKFELTQIEQDIGSILHSHLLSIFKQTHRYLAMFYMLSHAGEAQAIAQVSDKPAKMALGKNKIKIDSFVMIQAQFNILRRNIISQLELSIAREYPVDKALGLIYMKAFPKRVLIPKNKKQVLKKVKATEASRPDMKGNDTQLFFDHEFDQETWNNILEEYQNEYEPVDRSPAAFTDMTNPYTDVPINDLTDEGDKVYDWEVEQNITNMYVDNVRAGQEDAANANGVNEFVWIAIIDKKTCGLCCEWRHGLLTSEIEEKLAKHPELKEHCDATTPPAHFNCRCSMAPASNDLERVDNADIEKDFDQWLEG